MPHPTAMSSVVTPLLRSNLPGRISLRVISEKDSKLVLPDQPDAAYLIGKGELFMNADHPFASSVRF